MAKLDEMKYDDLLRLLADIKLEIKEFRPVRIKKKWKRCGKSECFCMDGPADGSWGNLHGPYLFAQYVDHKTRKTKVVSLGRFWGQEAIIEAQGEILEWWNYFKVSPGDRDKMTENEASAYRWWYSVQGQDFANFYGLRQVDDALDRHTRYYGTEALHDAFEAYRSEFARRSEAFNHEWASVYGLASHTGQKLLEEILRENYYLKG